MQLFESGDYNDLEEIQLTVKYDGPSFEGVMNIADLGNELLGIEYCLKTILRKLVQENKKSIKNKEILSLIKDIDVADFEIVTEGFVNNCFLKRIKFKKAGKILELLDAIENRPELNKYILALIAGGMTVYGTIYVAQISADKDVLLKALEKGTVPLGIVQEIQSSDLGSDAKKVAIQLLKDPKYREEASKAVVPIKHSKDTLNLGSHTFEPIVQGGDIALDRNNKDIYLLRAQPSDDEDGFEVRFDTVIGRINYIDLDARTNQIGFKVFNEGSEIRCRLIDSLQIDDYKDYLGEWVEIEGNITISTTKTEHIEIHKIKRVSSPLSEAKQVSLIHEKTNNYTK